MSPAHPKPGKKRKTIGQRSRDQVDAIRPMVLLRDDYRCVVSGTPVGATSPCDGTATIQHRVGRGAGGSTQFDGPAYLLVMCVRHNVLETSSAAFAADCLENGWSLRRNAVDVDPTQIPVRYRDGWYLLDADGCSRQRVHPNIADKLMERAS
jgi:hypothetical protein